MDYTEAELDTFIRDAQERGQVDLVKYYQRELERIRSEKKRDNV